MAISDVAKKYGLYLHMDGSRITNAAASLNSDFAAITTEVGVDVLSFGGTKNGMMFGEAIVIFNPALASQFKYFRKQGMQLHSKMRFISAQFDAMLTNDLWRKNASHANRMASYIEKELVKISGVKITQPVDANAIFATLPPTIIPDLQQQNYFYIWNEQTFEVRLMCAFDTTKEDIDGFIARLKALVSG
jgi:threonine aldolase